VLLFGKQDVLLNKYLIDNSTEASDIDEKEKEALRQKQHLRLQRMIDYCHTSGCLRRYILGYFGENLSERCEHCSGCKGLRPLPKAKSPEKEALPNDLESAFTALRLLRNRLALEKKVPAYLIFTDASLREMAASLPKDMASFLQISGVGDIKAQSYGEIFLKLIEAIKNVLGRGPITKEDASLLANQVYENTKPWSDAEILRLRLLFAQGMDAHAIASELKRGLWQVEKQLELFREEQR
jgi:ATP-dependent DNA helicase RecQ